MCLHNHLAAAAGVNIISIWKDGGEIIMSYVLEHTAPGFCLWDLPAAIILIAVIAVFIWKVHDMKQQEKDLEDQISGLYADDAAGNCDS